uniref:Uncharacterized protein n=1 Tax=Nelumbo nucifera TaxID=4432 RepID=A0A822YMU8_NELNU|nr:TPA_asm: hypothetical protein HUJ06_012658 [Nelumbo nucifera]
MFFPFFLVEILFALFFFGDNVFCLYFLVCFLVANLGFLCYSNLQFLCSDFALCDFIGRVMVSYFSLLLDSVLT